FRDGADVSPAQRLPCCAQRIFHALPEFLIRHGRFLAAAPGNTLAVGTNARLGSGGVARARRPPIATFFTKTSDHSNRNAGHSNLRPLVDSSAPARKGISASERDR